MKKKIGEGKLNSWPGFESQISFMDSLLGFSNQQQIRKALNFKRPWKKILDL
jgi:hypothetical protein